MKKEILTPQQIKNVEEAIKKAESKTRAEIVPVISNQSGSYQYSQFIFSFIFSLVIFSISWLNFQSVKVDDWGKLSVSMNLFYIILIILFSFIIGAILAKKFRVLSLLFLNKDDMAFEIDRAAKQCFYDFSIGNTKGATGVLIYISLLERTVMVKGDIKISQKLTQNDWDNICNLITNGIKENKADQGIISGIEAMTVFLAEHFPRQNDDSNELENKIHFIN
ncbi:MAG: TPM domain-containing protein [Rickettsiales bacterium]|nr:TPM domain-containing protein [Rickettsiales bacterium]